MNTQTYKEFNRMKLGKNNKIQKFSVQIFLDSPHFFIYSAGKDNKEHKNNYGFC